jgi:hypothetical protein
MYAYTSKGPFLLEREEWKKLSEFGAEILLKNRVSAENERYEINSDIQIQERNARRVFIGHGRSLVQSLPVCGSSVARTTIRTSTMLCLISR